MSKTPDPRLILAADPAPSAISRGPVARAHWRRDLTASEDLAAAVLPSGLSAEFPAVMAETHARLLDPAGVSPLPSPSSVGVAVGDALTRHDAWQTLCDAAALHPSIAREAVIGLADVVKNALIRSGTANTDTRRHLRTLEEARERLRKLRQRRDDTAAAAKADPTEENKAAAAQAMREALEAANVEERASSAVQTAAAAGQRVAKAIDDSIDPLTGDDPIAAIAAKVTAQAGGMQAMLVAGLGDALGSQEPGAVPDDLVRALSPDVVRILRKVGALRLALRDGRAARHLPGREGCEGADVGGLDRIGDLLPTERAALAGVLGSAMQTLTRYKLVCGTAAVMEKGGGDANAGDVVVVVDKSGSMQGDRDEAASALALCIVLEARAANRVCGVVTYDGRVRCSVVVDDPASFRRAFKAIVAQAGGDNNERRALAAAAPLLKRLRNGGASADVLMITDGQWSAKNLDGHTIAADQLSCLLIGGCAPPGARFKNVWEVREIDDKISIEVAAALV